MWRYRAGSPTEPMPLSDPLGESSASAVVAARHSAALDHIVGHFQDPELSLEAVARCQGHFSALPAAPDDVIGNVVHGARE